LVDAFAKVYKQDSKTRLIILGEGTERQMLENKINELGLSEVVELPGFVNNPFAYLNQASLFVLSSNFEGLPTVLIEALACGTPVVATRCPSGPREILEDGKYGELVPVGHEEQLRDAILKQLSTKQDNKLLLQRAQDFSVANSIEKYEQLVSSLLKKGLN